LHLLMCFFFDLIQHELNTFQPNNQKFIYCIKNGK
jgi:hypothetical protein